MRYDGRFFAPVRINLIANNFLPPLSLFPLPLERVRVRDYRLAALRPSPQPSPKGEGENLYRRRFFLFFFFRDGPAGKPGIPPIMASPPSPLTCMTTSARGSHESRFSVQGQKGLKYNRSPSK